jgi:hypothetical protein
VLPISTAPAVEIVSGSDTYPGSSTFSVSSSRAITDTLTSPVSDQLRHAFHFAPAMNMYVIVFTQIRVVRDADKHAYIFTIRDCVSKLSILRARAADGLDATAGAEGSKERSL